MNIEKSFKLGMVAIATLAGLCLAGMGLVALFGLGLALQDRLLNLALCWAFGFFPMVLWYRLRLGSRMSAERIKYLAIVWPITCPIMLATGKLRRR